jgi:hypothetical protein
MSTCAKMNFLKLLLIFAIAQRVSKKKIKLVFLSVNESLNHPRNAYHAQRNTKSPGNSHCVLEAS